MRPMSPRLVAALLAACVALPSGCATILRNSKQDITISCNRPPATVRVDGATGMLGVNRLERETSHQITGESGGKTASGWVSADISIPWLLVDIFLGGLVGIVVDAITGAWNDLSPSNLTLTIGNGCPADEAVEGRAL